MTTNNTGDEALDPASMLALATNQQKSVSARRGSFVAVIMAVWGVALLVGFLVLWSIDGLKNGIPSSVAVGIFIGLIVVGSVLSAVLGVRSDRGIRTADNFTGTIYGISWSVAMAGLGVLGGGLILHGLDGHLLLLFYSSLYTFLIGLLFFVAGAIWHAIPSLILGGWLALVAAVAPYLGYPNHYLLLAFGGGGAFIVLSIVTAARARRGRGLVTSNG